MTTETDSRRAAARAATRLAKLLHEASWCSTDLRARVDAIAAELDRGEEPEPLTLALVEPKPKETPAALLCADFLDVIGTKYAFNGAKDGAALKWLLQQAPLDEVRRRWRVGLRMPSDRWGSTRTIAQLRSKWNDLAKLNTSAGWRDDAAQSKGGFFDGT